MTLGKKILSNVWGQRIFFWCVSLLFFYRLFSKRESGFSPIDLLYAALFLALLAPMVLVVNHWLIPTFVNRARYFLSIFIYLLFSILGTLLNQWFFDGAVDRLFPGLYLINYYSFTELWQFYLAFPAVAGLLQLSKGWFLHLEASQRIEQLKAQNLEAELKSLKGQVNPHFLFNALNSIYALALKNSEKTAPSVMQLSDLLRYSLYQTEKEYVRIEDEIEMIEKYIEIQETRLQHPVHIQLDFKNYDPGFKIPPMLLQPLFENAFKHGDTMGRPFIKADLFTSEDKLTFSISNPVFEPSDTSWKDSGGVGLHNIQKRLELIYPDKHQFKTTETGTHFMVQIEIYSHERA